MSSWTRAEDEALRTTWPTGGIAAVREVLPQRSAFSICYRARRLLGPLRRRKWTIREEAKLRAMWDASYTLVWLARKLGRSEKAVYEKAQSLGLLQSHANRGYENLSHAARRAGCSTRQLRVALERYTDSTPACERGAKTRHALSLSSTPRMVLVEPDFVDAAVAAWTRG